MSSILEFVSRISEKIPKWLLIFVSSGLPSALTVVLVQATMNTGIESFIPVLQLDDQLGYWHEIKTFSRAGFNGGYYSYLEQPAAVPFFRFDVHGPMFAITYGLISKLTGWSYTTGIYINMAMIALGFGFYAWKSNLSRAQILLASLALLSCWPVLFFIPSLYQESLNQSIGMILAAMFGLLIKDQERSAKGQVLVLLVFMVYISLLRYSWILLLVPIFILIFPKTLRMQAIAIGSAVLFGAMLYFLVSKISAPGLGYPQFYLDMFNQSFSRGMDTVVTEIRSNLKRYFFPNFDLFLVLRANVVILGMWSLTRIIVLIKKNPGRLFTNSNVNQEVFTWVIILYSLLTLSIGSISIYPTEGDFRLLAPVVILSLFTLIQMRKYVPVIVMALFNVSFFTLFVLTFRSWWGHCYAFDQQLLLRTRTVVENHIEYQPEVRNPWCNTVLIPTKFYDYRVTQIPGGIGISYFVSKKLGFPTMPLNPGMSG